MPITYMPPKGQIWGHGVGRLSAWQPFERTERFLRERTLTIDPGETEWRVTCEAGSSDAITAAFDASPLVAGRGEDVEMSTPDGRTLRSIKRKLPPASLGDAVRWLEALEPELRGRGDVRHFSLDQDVVFLWRASPGGEDAVPGTYASTFGVCYARPRWVTTCFSFASIAHYREIKRHLQEIGLVALSDKHVRPKKAMAEAPRETT